MRKNYRGSIDVAKTKNDGGAYFEQGLRSNSLTEMIANSEQLLCNHDIIHK